MVKVTVTEIVDTHTSTLWKRKEFATTHEPTYVTALGQCINPACICMYLRLAERRVEGRREEWTRGNPYVTSSPTRANARFVSLADFCRLTPKHPWTLPPPFTFNLYQSIQPSRRIERMSVNETGRTGRERHRALFTADSVFTPSPLCPPPIHLPLSPSFTLSPSTILFHFACPS